MNDTTRNVPSRRRQSGFSLIEALVSMVVLSIGLLGLAGLQTSALKFNQTAQLRSKAVTLAYDMQERVRSSFTLFQSNDPYSTTLQTEWNTAVATQLPSGVGALCWVTNPSAPTTNCGANWFQDGYAVISVTWNEATDVGSARNAQTIRIVSRE
ncbi:MAG: type IV pilus modification protein PilV [Denitromonas halophila]|nr:MAG: type IV pilus modification protein PilV [Denitromonas halophila]TVT71891.1 MAG: type IV pilus modification protein PilV [Denitromonas halophila]